MIWLLGFLHALWEEEDVDFLDDETADQSVSAETFDPLECSVAGDGEDE